MKEMSAKKQGSKENFREIKNAIFSNGNYNNQVLICLNFLADRDVECDVSSDLVESYMFLLECGKKIKQDGYFNLLRELIRSSMIDAIKKTKELDLNTKLYFFSILGKCSPDYVLGKIKEEELEEQALINEIDSDEEYVEKEKDLESVEDLEELSELEDYEREL